MKKFELRRANSSIFFSVDGQTLTVEQLMAQLPEQTQVLAELLCTSAALGSDLFLPIVYVAALLVAQDNESDLHIDWDGEEVIPAHRVYHEIGAHIKTQLIPAVRDGDFAADKELCIKFMHWLTYKGWMQDEEYYEMLRYFR